MKFIYESAFRFIPSGKSKYSFYCVLISLQSRCNSVMLINASPGLSRKKTTRAIKSPCPFGCVGYLALAELLVSFYI